MADRRGDRQTAPKIQGGKNHGENRARRSSNPPSWRKKRADSGKPRSGRS